MYNQKTSKPLSLFWWRWLVCAALGVIGFGLVLAIAPQIMENLFNWMLFSVSRLNNTFSDPTVNYIRFVYRVLGAVMVGWGVGLLCIVATTFRRGDPAGWYALTLSILSWFVLDSSLSLLTGFGENAILNCVFLVLFAMPLVATYKRI